MQHDTSIPRARKAATATGAAKVSHTFLNWEDFRGQGDGTRASRVMPPGWWERQRVSKELSRLVLPQQCLDSRGQCFSECVTNVDARSTIRSLLPDLTQSPGPEQKVLNLVSFDHRCLYPKCPRNKCCKTLMQNFHLKTVLIYPNVFDFMNL